jgi:7-carboxy-7-deazaguanine synthase
VENKSDFDYVLEAYDRAQLNLGIHQVNWVITPAYGTQESFPQARFIDIQNWNYACGGKFRVIGQQHKWIYGPKEMLV